MYDSLWDAALQLVCCGRQSLTLISGLASSSSSGSSSSPSDFPSLASSAESSAECSAGCSAAGSSCAQRCHSGLLSAFSLAELGKECLHSALRTWDTALELKACYHTKQQVVAGQCCSVASASHMQRYITLHTVKR